MSIKSGRYPSRPPYGYKRITLSDGETDIVPDEFASRVVLKIYEWYASGAFTMDLVRKKLLDDHGIKWSKGFLDKVLKDQFYYGVMTWKNKQYSHKYYPIITKQLFDLVQQTKVGFNKKLLNYAGKPYMNRGLLRCGHCGLAIKPEKHKGHVYYHCTQYNGKYDAEWLREEDITEQIGSVFKRLQMPEEVLQQILDNLTKTHQDKMEFQNQHFLELSNKRKTTTTMIDNQYLDKHKLRSTDDTYDKFYETLRAELSEIDTRLALLQEAEDNYYITAQYLVETTQRAYELIMCSEVEEKRQFIKLVLSNFRIEGKKV